MGSFLRHNVGNKAKGRILKRVLQENSTPNFLKNEYLTFKKN